MAGPKLSEDELRNVARQVADFVNPQPRGFNEIASFGKANEPLALYESFPVVHIDMERARAALEQNHDLSTALVNLEQWHHQVRAGETVQAFARSQPDEHGSTQMSVRLLERSNDAALIDRAIRIIDDDRGLDSDSFEPVILDSRVYDIGALVLIPEPESNSPYSLAQVYRAPRGQDELVAERRYESKDFLSRFVRLRPVGGVTFEQDDEATR